MARCTTLKSIQFFSSRKANYESIAQGSKPKHLETLAGSTIEVIEESPNYDSEEEEEEEEQKGKGEGEAKEISDEQWTDLDDASEDKEHLQQRKRYAGEMCKALLDLPVKKLILGVCSTLHSRTQ